MAATPLWAASVQSGEESAVEERVIDEIMAVTARPLQLAPVQSTQRRLPPEELIREAPASAAEALALVASANVTTNSRGETLVFPRNAGERQVAVFYDGAAINQPWDNRLNLDLVPATALEGLVVTSGPSSVRYGANTAGGIVELLPAVPNGPGLEHRSTVQGGSGGFVEASHLLLARTGPLSITAAVGYLERNGQTLPDSDVTAGEGRLRNNTDRRRVNGLFRMGLEAGPRSHVVASLLVTSSRFGIAPEAFDRPSQGSPRFWRYPDTDQVVGLLHGRTAWGSGEGTGAFEGTVWVQDADLTIESFASDAYEVLEDVEIDEDRSYGFRGILSGRHGRHTLTGSLNGLWTEHRQQDIAFLDGALPMPVPPAEIFQDRRVSLGGEYETSFGDVDILAGVGLDWLDPLRTGGRPDSGAFTTWNVIGGVRWQASDTLTWRLSAGRKTRLPTPRELFGTALDRFLINPDLEAEKVLLVEGGLELDLPWLDLSFIPFASLVSDTIDQQTVEVDGNTLRQRINLRGSRVYGVEMEAVARLSESLSLTARVTATRARQREDGTAGRRLAERPGVLARLTALYNRPEGFEADLSLVHRGRAFSFTDEDRFEPLALSTSLEAGIAYRFALLGPRLGTGRPDMRLFLRARNLTDTLIEPQLGLPGEGRTIRGGLSVSF